MFQTILFFVSLTAPDMDCQKIARPALNMQAPTWAFSMPTEQCVKNVGSTSADEFLKNVLTVVDPFDN